mmetsp:Transcript_35151/g.48010  ORF Transcript_35151/g.48010 Transcript_35151/m.48010 type:complete len:466 (-) Transcript_35151:82-1479(-)|eukprot:CAMPEP_0201492104 /NCGR_PEP_ID=MMETSP0151_2-20130828/32077_1 /ASSEMBLY_ACC=CAM_ASM_000257 /TAXON_ID=200890 /ORGANISM="Paramoeba atlantica, Strain 621/1 / CCAP 1560/9" /LENGTH=465 /DNA_ID=CAMNT_0047878767 /DNA_START=59 /DNA_END=1456 /DNA_ORIENTATION=+
MGAKSGKLPDESPYDLVVDIQNITNLAVDGWPVQIAEGFEQHFEKEKDKERNLVAVVGQFNHGKTWFLSRMSSENLSSGTMVTTKGLSVKCSEISSAKNFVLLDTEGSDSCVEYNELQEKRATESFQRELVIELATIVVVVVNRLRRSDQIFLQNLTRSLYVNKKTGLLKTLFVVHNFCGTEKEEDIDVLIQTEIEGVFRAQKQSMVLHLERKGVDSEAFYWQSMRKTDTYDERKIDIQHFVVAKEGSPAGEKWNDQSVGLIRQLIDASIKTRRPPKLVEEIIKFSEFRLPSYLHISSPKLFFDKVAGKITVEGDSHKYKLVELSFNEVGTVTSLVSPQGLIRPPYNIVETEDYYDIHVDLAGATITDLKKTRHLVTIHARRAFPSFDQKNKGEQSSSSSSLPEEEHNFTESGQRFLRQDVGFGDICFSEQFTCRLDVHQKALRSEINGLHCFRLMKEKDLPVPF